MIFKVLILLLFSQQVYSQYAWQVIHKDSAFQDISCVGRFCTLTGYVYGDQAGYRIWNSEDWGKTWTEVSPSIADSLTGKPFNTVTRIDSSHIFIAGSRGLFMASSDGGSTWKGKTVANVNFFSSHFRDTLNGICSGRIGDGNINQLYTTIDGGETWEHIPFNPSSGFLNSWSEGNQKFKVFNYPYGPIYSTANNWATRDSTAQIIQDTDAYSLAGCTFSFGDTTFVYGTHSTGGFPVGKGLRGLIMRSTTNGQSWELTTLLPMDSGGVSQVFEVTRPDDDTILAGGLSRNKIAISFDGGITWQFDTLPLPQVGSRTDIYKLVKLDNGNVLGIYGDDRLSPRTRVFLGEPVPSSVRKHEPIQPSLSIYPNPATESITIDIPANASLQIVDALGRTMKTFQTQPSGPLRVDVSAFSPGCYQAIARFDTRIAVSSFIIK